MNNKIDNPHFYNDSRYDGTFEDLMNQAVGGISRHKDLPKMHLWLPSTATDWQIQLVERIIGDDTGRDSKDTGRVE